MTVDVAPAALRSAVERAGGQSATARILKVSQAAVWKWLDEGKVLPAEHVLTLEAATNISRHDLRPDIYPREDTSLDGQVSL
ncbi:YdaS family helix-turn-helix protein [uncultured Sphingomonas sp.]|uniref:transcriptional regulator n=1 Tax=uncultured Sphingomonas sp. TaxID=158754 RepID=UPI0030FC6A7D